MINSKETEYYIWDSHANAIRKKLGFRWTPFFFFFNFIFFIFLILFSTFYCFWNNLVVILFLFTFYNIIVILNKYFNI